MTRTWRRTFVAALFICSAAAAETKADNARPCERAMARAAQLHGIPLGILYAVGLTETGRRGALYPYALGADGQTVFAKNMDDAMSSFEAMRQKGIKPGESGELNHAAMRLARYSSSQPAVLRRRRMESFPGAFRVRL